MNNDNTILLIYRDGELDRANYYKQKAQHIAHDIFDYFGWFFPHLGHCVVKAVSGEYSDLV